MTGDQKREKKREKKKREEKEKRKREKKKREEKGGTKGAQSVSDINRNTPSTESMD